MLTDFFYLLQKHFTDLAHLLLQKQNLLDKGNNNNNDYYYYMTPGTVYQMW